MTYVIIGVVLLLIIVPIFSVLPSVRQRQQMAMRMAARGEGVSVELTTIKDPNPDQEKYISHIGKRIEPDLKVAAYRVQRHRESGWRQLQQVNWCLKKDLAGAWHWDQPAHPAMSDELQRFLDEQVPALPEDVEQVHEVGYNIVVYWHERNAGDEKVVFDFLKQCAALPLRKPSKDE